MRVMQADIMVMKYVELIQVQIILNMKFRFFFLHNVSLF